MYTLTLTLQQWLVIEHFLIQKGRRTQHLQFLNSQPLEAGYPSWYAHVTQNNIYVALRYLCSSQLRIDGLYFQSKHMVSPRPSHFQPNVSDEYSIEESSHPTTLNYLPTTISAQYSVGSCFSPNPNKIFECHCNANLAGKWNLVLMRLRTIIYQACRLQELNVPRFKCTPNFMCWSLELASRQSLLSVKHHAYVRIVEPKSS